MADHRDGSGTVVRALLHTCLKAWPRQDRERLGSELVSAALESIADADARWSHVAYEAWAIVGGGVRRRRELLAGATGPAMAGLFTDVRISVRSLRRSAGFTVLVVGILAVGIAAATTAFTLLDAVLLSPPPFPRADELVAVWNRLPDSDDRIAVAGPDAAVLEERARTLAQVGFTIRGVDGSVQATSAATPPHHVHVASVTPDFFQVLGLAPALGRTFDVEDAVLDDPSAPGGALSAILAHDAWRNTFGGAPDIVGDRVLLNGWPVTVVGVMPADFRLPLPPEAGIVTDIDVWIPLTTPLELFHREGDRLLDRDSDNTGVVVARLAAGASLESARQELDDLAADLRRDIPAYAASGVRFDVRPLVSDATAHARPVLVAVFVASLALLAVIYLNVATLLLARGLDRAPELAVRMALGGARLRIFRQLLVENGLLVGTALLGAALLSASVSPTLGSFVPAALGPLPSVEPSSRSLALHVLLGGCALLLFAMAPAARAAAHDARGSLSRGLGRASSSPGRTRERLVATQVALSVVLLLGAGLVLSSVRALESTRPGFETEGALTFRLSLRMPDRYRSPARRAELMKEIETGLAELPGVRAVGLVGVLPLGGDRWSQPYGLPGEPEEVWRENRADFQMISSGYFDALGARLLEGRRFTTQEDLAESERVVIVDEKLAARVAPDGSALDAVIGIPLDGSAVQARIVGVVEHVRHERLDADGQETVYVPYRQEASRDVTFVVRSSGDPTTLAPQVRRVVRVVDPQIPVFDLVTLEEYVADATAPSRFALSLLAVFASLTLACSALGIFSVVAFDVSRRTRDIGLRVAVGASRRTITTGVVVRGLRIAAPGIVAGILLGLATFLATDGLLADMEVGAPGVWAAVVGTVLILVVLASWLPARRAGRLNPVTALRAE